MTGAQRIPAYPGTPTIAESGFPGFDMDDWNGMFAPSGVPAAILPRMQTAVAAAARDEMVLSRMAPLGTVMVGNSTAEFTAWLAQQREVVTRVIRDANIMLE